MHSSERDIAEELSSLAARRGFFWNAYELYGGVSGFVTWGPLGSTLKRKIADLWREVFVAPHGFVEIDTPTIAPYDVFEASGHVERFKDVMVSCRSCGHRYKAVELLGEAGSRQAEALSPLEIDSEIKELSVTCPECGGSLGGAQPFTTMFQTSIGPLGEDIGFLRPETAQGMFTEFKRVYSAERKSMPLGIAQIGRGFRNEISPRQGPIRLREFDMMELELFYDPDDPDCPSLREIEKVQIGLIPKESLSEGDEEPIRLSLRSALEEDYIVNEWLAYFMGLAQGFMTQLGIPPENQRFREQLSAERAHYSQQTFDQEVLLSRWGWVEVSGHAMRTNFDLEAHIRGSGEDLTAERVLEEAVKITEKTVRPRIELIKELVGEDIGDVMVDLNAWEDSEILEELESEGHVESAGHRLDRGVFETVTSEKERQIERFVPYVSEPSFGLERVAYATLEYSYGTREDRVVMSIPAMVAPLEAAVFPIVSKEPLETMATRIHERLVHEGISSVMESKEAIGRRYARADEIGVPVCITVDRASLDDETVTVRNRDTWRQERIVWTNCGEFVRQILASRDFEEAIEEMKS